MSILEQKAFVSSIHPFENLSANQLDNFAESIDIVYFKENEIVQAQGKKPECLFFNDLMNICQLKMNKIIIIEGYIERK